MLKDFKIYNLFYYILLLVSFLAQKTEAQVEIVPSGTGKTPQTVNEIFSGFSAGNMAGFIPVLILVGFVTFLTGVVKYIRAGDNEEQRSSGRSVMIYGIIVLFVMISIWGLVALLTQTFIGKDPTLPNYLPRLN